MNYEPILIVLINVFFGIYCIYNIWKVSVRDKYVFDYTSNTPDNALKVYDKKEENE